MKKKRWQTPLKVFFSYSSEDSIQRDILEQQLTGLRDELLIETWHDRKLPLGKWEPELHNKLEQADLFLCLVSSAFLSSTYCREIEFERAQERCDFGQCEIVPVALKPVYWPDWLRVYTGLPDPKKYIVDNPQFPGQSGYLEVAEMLASKVRQMAGIPEPVSQAEPEAMAVEADPAPSTWLPELDLLPYLCDRQPQESNVRSALRPEPGKASAAPVPDTRPFVLISCGPDPECHEEFLRRVRRDPLPYLLGMRDKPEDWSPRLFIWPDLFQIGDDLSQPLAERVADRMNSLRCDKQWLKTKLKDGLTVVEAELKGPLNERDSYLLEQYLHYWNSWWTEEAPLPPRKALVVAIWVKSPAYGAVTAEQLRQRFALSRWPNLRGAVLDELKPVTPENALDWALNDAVKPHYARDRYQSLSREILNLFGEETDLPMRTLAPGLLSALRKVNIGRNG